MLTKNNLMVVLWVALVMTFGAGSAFAEREFGEIPSHADNQAWLAEGLKHTEEALTAAKAGDGAATKTHTKAATKEFGEIYSEEWASKLQSAKSKIRVAGIKAGKGDTEAAVPLLEQGIAAIKQLK